MEKMFIYLYIALGGVLAVTVHEYTKAVVSHKLGDPLPKNRLRLTLNPVKHLEPIGFICLVATGGYGWGRPVETSAIYYRDRKKGALATYIMPSVINLVVGVSFAVLCKFLGFIIDSYFKEALGIALSFLVQAKICLYFIASINVKIALFNIIPIYPLDGAKVLGSMLSPANAIRFINYEKLLQMLLIFILIGGIVPTFFDPLANVLISFSW